MPTVLPRPDRRRPPVPTARLAAAVVALAAGAALAVAGPPVFSEPALPAAAMDATTVDPIYFPLSPRRDPARPDRQYPDDLLRQFMDYHTAGRYELAAEMALRLVAAAPDEAIGHYNLACAMARLRRADEAIAALERAIELGWRNGAHMAIDPDLQLLRRDERFASLSSELERLATAERLEPRPLRLDPVETIVGDLETIAPRTMAAARVPGLAVAYVRDGRVAWSGTFGLGDRRAQRPLAADDRFLLWTPSHLLALMAAAQQAEAGEGAAAELVQSVIDLQELLAEDVPGVRRPRLASRGDGSSSVAEATLLASGALPSVRATAQRADLVFELLRHEIETAADENFKRCCRRMVLDPLGMSSTGFAGDASAQEAARAMGHSQFGTPVTPGATRGTGRAMLTTAHDLGSLVAHLARPGDDVTDMSLAMAEAWPFTGLAVRADRGRSGRVVEITEDRDGVGCLVRWYPDAGIGVAILYNGQRGSEAARRIAHRALGGGA